MPLRSRRLTGQEPEIREISMLYVATKGEDRNLSMFNPNNNKNVLKEAVVTLKDRNEGRFLEKYKVGCLLNQVSAKEET